MVAKAPSSTPKADDTDLKVVRPEIINLTLPEIGDVVIRPLGFFAKTELFSLLAGAVNDLFTEGASLTEVLGELDLSEQSIAALKSGSSSPQADRQAEVIARVIVKFALRAPKLLDDLFLIALQTKPEEKKAFLNALHNPEFDDENAFALLNAFVDLNGSAFIDFFGNWRTLLEKTASLRRESQN